MEVGRGGAAVARKKSSSVSRNPVPPRNTWSELAVERLNRGRRANGDVIRIEIGANVSVVVKDFAPRSRFVRKILAHRLLAREVRAYERLAGLSGIPRFLGWVDSEAIGLEYCPGVLVSRSLRGKLPASFLDELEVLVAQMHRRGVVHLDLRHRSNVLANESGHPIVLDFGSAVCFDPTTRLGRACVRLLGRIDDGAVRKWRDRLI